jgi:hypothetical protein
LHIACGGFLRQRVIRSLRFLGFGCRHLSPCSREQAEKL